MSIREGLYGGTLRPAEQTVCFVCTGNTCRSPMAAAIFNHMVAKEGHPPLCRAVSCGLAVCEGEPITQNAVLALMTAGIPATPENDYPRHTARPACLTSLAACSHIVAVSRAHAVRLLMAFPELAPRLSVMPRDIPDPYGGDINTYAACLNALEEGIRTLFFE